ncbi:MAG TPA: hypothetical protein VG106_00435 [Vicinamibacterales bacterium]|nr:hypothetical protein [Vicinamibacterales bacterium]
MDGATRFGPTVERLADHLFDGALDDPTAAEITEWLAGSARFRGFAEAYRDTIRRKWRGAIDAESRKDLRAELRAAHLLLADRRIELAFETYGSARSGPDFTVTFRGERSFNVEVTRVRGATRASGHAGPLLAKLRQLPPSVPNLVLVAIEGGSADLFDAAGATRMLRARADAKDDEFFAARGFRDARAFYQRYLRLGAVIVWCEGATDDERAMVWSNPSARITVPVRAAQACASCLRAAEPTRTLTSPASGS